MSAVTGAIDGIAGGGSNGKTSPVKYLTNAERSAGNEDTAYDETYDILYSVSTNVPQNS
jgi:hypothetical protein